jgi:hypothetical protein
MIRVETSTRIDRPVKDVFADGATAFSVVLEAQPGASALFKLGEPILTGVGRRRFRGHLRRLKRRLESGTAGARQAA